MFFSAVHYILLACHTAVSCNIPSGYTTVCKVHHSTADRFIYGLMRPIKTNT